MSDDELKIVDWMHFERSRAELGAGFIVSAGASYVISTRHGLIGGEPRAQHE